MSKQNNNHYDYSNITESELRTIVEGLHNSSAINEKSDKEKEVEEISIEKEDEEREEKAANADNFDVVYAKNSFTNIFKHIVVFTNNRDSAENKTLKNIEDAIKDLKKKKCPIIPELHVFVAAKVVADDDEREIVISDDKEEFVITDQSNVDTLIFSRLGIQGEDECEHVVNLLQDRGFLVLNPVKYSELASDKYQTALLLQKGEIPQPNFCLMTKDILYDEELYKESLQKVYPEFTGDKDKDEDLQFVVKILDGHGGTGVTLINGKQLEAVLQQIFAIDPERQLIIQKKEEADGGDIRVHVLTLRNKQVILGAMKRIKIASDFRSNVSLGATAEPVKLTPEQEQIALKAAKISKLPWCACDIMPLKKGSNKEIGDNVVLELNASPGTAGITDVLKENFVNILLSELDDPSEFMLQNKVAGYIEGVDVVFEEGDKPLKMLAKLDTGNGAKASHIEVGEFTEEDGKISFTLQDKKYTFDKIGESRAITSDNNSQNVRPIIKIHELTLGCRKLRNVEMAIVKHRDKSTNMLLNRDTLAKFSYVVSSNDTHLLSQEMEKIKIV